MIIGNTLKFGYGDIVVGAHAFDQTISFQQIEPAQDVGSTILMEAGRIRKIGSPICIGLDFKKYNEYMRNIDMVEVQENKVFLFEGYTFDFTNYNPKSIHMCKKKAKESMYVFFMAMAC